MVDEDGILKQCRIEIEALSHTRKALLAIIAWPVEGKMFTRKLSGLRFQGKSFQNHVERLFAIEEHDGYMDMITESSPHLAGKIQGLQREHTLIRTQLCETMTDLDRLLPDDVSKFDVLCSDLTAIVKSLDAHHHKETRLLQEALSEDLGGEGGA